MYTDLLLPKRPPKMNMWQSIAAATWNARGLGPTWSSDPLPVHSGWNQSLFSESIKNQKLRIWSHIQVQHSRQNNNHKLIYPIYTHQSTDTLLTFWWLGQITPIWKFMRERQQMPGLVLIWNHNLISQTIKGHQLKPWNDDHSPVPHPEGKKKKYLKN